MHNKFLPALIFLALFFFEISGLRAQSFYNFPPVPPTGTGPDDVPATTGTGHNILTMDCLAANGYGQWTSSNSTTNSTTHPALFLLANRLTASITDDVQAGVLAAKAPTFTSGSGDAYPTEAIKCAANLQGNVRYVWLDNTSGRDHFYVNGFDPATSTNASTGIGIDFVGLGSGGTSGDIVKDGSAILFVGNSSSPTVIPSGHTLVTSSNEPLFPDMFDVAIDANFLYVVWEEDVSGVFSIHAAAVNLSTSAVTQLGTVGNGRRPTVSIDVRTSGGSAADIDVAYLTSVPGSINWAEWNGATWITLPVPTLVTGTATSWSNATHARIVDASNPGQGTTDKAIYFIAEDHSTGNVSLFFNRITTPGGLSLDCTYCDGTLITTQRPSGSPIATSGGFAVKDDYIRAFANPYDGANSPFDEFHCLYVLISPTLTPPAIGALPLMIINGTNSATGYCMNGNGSSTFFDDPVEETTNEPSQYQGAVNQMGIHVHWIGLNHGDHFYMRDPRPFDQDITENTLLTGACEVSAGGSSTITLKNNHLTLYSDPDFTHNAVYTGGGILTIDNGVTLDINSSSGVGDFVALGAETITFSNFPMTGPLAGNNYAILAVEAGNQMDFYGNANNAMNGIGEFRFTGSGDYVVTGTYGTYASSISDAAILNIHGGATFGSDIAGTGEYLTCTDAKIHFNSETNVLTGSGTADGALILWNHSSFTKSWLISDDNGTASNPTIIVINTNGTAGSGPPSFINGSGNADYNGTYSSLTFSTDTFEQCTFSTADTSHATVVVLGRFVAPNSLIVDNGYVEGVSFVSPAVGSGSINPYWPISFTNVQFERIVQFGIDISFAFMATQAEDTEYSLLVDNCGFLGYDNMTHFSNPDGIKVEAADDFVVPGVGPTEPQDLLRQQITIENNDFPAEGLYDEPDGSVEAAIHFSDATGDILSNSIKAPMYRRGIWNESTTSTNEVKTWTFMCTNNIHSMENTEPALPAVPSTDAAGISTDNYEGYIKSDTVYFCPIGQISGVNDIGHIVFSGYAHNYGFAYAGSSTSATDITGVHHPGGGGDDPAFNIFFDNNSGGTQINLTGSLGATVFLGQAGPGSGSWSAFGDNDIEGSTDIASAVSVSLVDIGNNFWGGGSFSGTNVTFTDIAGDLASQDISRAFTCSAGDVAKRKGIIPLSIEVIDTPMTHCDSLLTNGYYDQQEGLMQNSYDTLRLFMQECPFYVGNKYNAGVHSWQVFTYVGGAVSGVGGAGRWADYLTWLKQVLYLNPDTMWYCDDVLQMLTALDDDQVAKEAAMQYILQSGKCLGFASDFATSYNTASYWRHEEWLDSIVGKYDTMVPYGVYSWWVDSLVNQDTLANPYDSTIPSLQQENLQILLGPQFANSVGASSPITSEALLSAQLLENPMQDEIAISYEMGRTALVTMELRDVLGRSVPIANAKYQLEQPGDHTATIPAPNLPPGIYYLRVTTDVGDAITLKIVKE